MEWLENEFEKWFEEEMFILLFSTVSPRGDIFVKVKGWMKDAFLKGSLIQKQTQGEE